VDREAHNLYLGMAAELGLIGLTVFLIIVGLTLRDLARARRAVRQHDSLMADITTGFMLSIVAYMATGIFLHMSFIRYFYLMLALAAASGLVSMAIARAHADDAGNAKPLAEPDGPSASEPRTERRPDPWGPDPRMDPFAT
jgi:O-antigen ligase